MQCHISMNSLKRSCQSKRCDFLNFYKSPKHFWQHMYPKVHHYLYLSFLDKFLFYKGLLLHWLIPITYIWNGLCPYELLTWMTVIVRYHRLINAKAFMSNTKLLNLFVQKIIHWLNFSHAWLTQKLVVSGMEKRSDFKELVSAHCFTKSITSNIRINTPVISFCKSNVVAWQKNQSYEILQFFQCYLNCGLFLSLLAYWLVSWRSNSMRGETTFSNEVHSVISTSSGFSRKTACAFLSWSKLENVCVCICCFCHFTFILDFLGFCFCFFAGGGSLLLSSPSEVILSISSFPILKTLTSPAISSGNPVVFKISSSSFSKSLSCPPVGGPIITTSADSGSSSWIWFTASGKKRCWVCFP